MVVTAKASGEKVPLHCQFWKAVRKSFFLCNAFDLVYLYPQADLHPIGWIINYILDTYMTNYYDNFFVTLLYLKKIKFL